MPKNYGYVSTATYQSATNLVSRLEAGAETIANAEAALLAKAKVTVGTLLSAHTTGESNLTATYAMGTGSSRPAMLIFTKANADGSTERKTKFFEYMPVSYLVAGTSGDIDITNVDIVAMATKYRDGFGNGGYAAELGFYTA
jgi:hypothetical protein